MDEPQVRAIFERLSGTEVPPSQVDVGLARLTGRRRLRRRRAILSGTPAVAVAVVALSANAILPAAPHGPHRGGHPVNDSPPPATAGFSPLVPYAEFGWLPAGVSLIAGNTGRFSQYLAAGPNAHTATWSLTVIAAGRCNLSSGQILRHLQHGGHPVLRCSTGPGIGYLYAPTGQAPPVSGRPAFWIDHQLLWENARGNWAVVGETGDHLHQERTVKVAAGVRFGLPRPALMFPVQLTGLPAAWRARSARFVPDDGVLRGIELSLTGPVTRVLPQATVDARLAGPGSRCFFSPGQSQRRTINGVAVVVTRVSKNPASVDVCAAHAHGLSLFVSTHGNESPRAVSIFRDHLRILGPDRSRWTAHPLG
jgi:hypothetical protein